MALPAHWGAGSSIGAAENGDQCSKTYHEKRSILFVGVHDPRYRCTRSSADSAIAVSWNGLEAARNGRDMATVGRMVESGAQK